MRFPQLFTIFLTTILLLITVAQAFPFLPAETIDYEQDSRLDGVDLAAQATGQQLSRREILNNMSNAQRMKRNLPLRKPGHMFDARLGARAPAPSEVNKRRDGL
ncbi:uncharacterized protein I303_104769 [Kwoniella dejecticola CBS 10117]|uniref:Uncharacterized protein n=1 Tax=Kwoniella dejecticola CBS 10117 TaxID=1296121 RepID=A0A1A6A4E0_9TREE|nr:uncharacterized protein I303_04250 [Kwoniella dejecticola CBS 10117]OBR84927.1 hypothetical protein I303_04250 [Kwoniella dejecticola CBS 10117]